MYTIAFNENHGTATYEGKNLGPLNSCYNLELSYILDFKMYVSE